MTAWKNFWNGLNIRKALALMFGIAMIVGSLAVVFTGLTSNPLDKDIITYGLTGIASVTTTLIGYYFGYSNGVKDSSSKEPDDQL